MKQHFLYLTVLAALLASCAAGPQAHLLELTYTGNEHWQKECSAVFPTGKWQFAHAIDFAMADGSGTPVIGVTSIDGNDIVCALFTVEGLTLFEAVFYQDGSIDVRRAVPPFTGADFAEGLIADIRAIFQPPVGSIKMGQVAGIMDVCRYLDSDGSVVDVLPTVDDGDDCWQIKRYAPDLTLEKSIVGWSCRKEGSSLIPDYLELTSYGQTGYTLKMTLISADKL